MPRETKNSFDSLYCAICFIAVVWEYLLISEVGLYFMEQLIECLLSRGDKEVEPQKERGRERQRKLQKEKGGKIKGDQRKGALRGLWGRACPHKWGDNCRHKERKSCLDQPSVCLVVPSRGFPFLDLSSRSALPRIRGLAKGIAMGVCVCACVCIHTYGHISVMHLSYFSTMCIFSLWNKKKWSAVYCHSIVIEDNCGIDGVKKSPFKMFFLGKFFERKWKTTSICSKMTNCPPAGGEWQVETAPAGTLETACFISFHIHDQKISTVEQELRPG